MVGFIIATKVNAERLERDVCLMRGVKVNAERLERYDCPMRGVRLCGETMVHERETRVGMQKHWTIIKEVKSWYMCGYLVCKLTPDCQYWNWQEYFPWECEMLKVNPGREYSEYREYSTNGYGTIISGNENCF